MKQKLIIVFLLLSSATVTPSENSSAKIVPHKNVPSPVTHEKPCPEPLVFEDEQAIEHYINAMFNDKDLCDKKISLRSKPAAIGDVIEMISLSLGIDFIVDPDVSGSVGKMNFEKGKPASEILKFLCLRNTPRLALIKQCGIWRIATHEKLFQTLKLSCRETIISKVFPLKHVRCDESLKNKIDDIWQRISQEYKHEHAYCSLDLESKKVFINATKKQLAKMEAFLKEIDCMSAQVRIDAVVALVERRYEHQLGFNWAGIYNRSSSVTRKFDFVGIGAAAKNSVTGNPDNFALNLFTKPTQTLKVPFIFSGPDLGIQQLMIELKAAEAESKAKILLKPSVLTSHNETAEILIGKSIPIKTFVEDQAKMRNVQTVNYKDVGTILNVRPIVSPDHKSALLDIMVEDSSVVEGPSVDHAPVIKTIRTKRSEEHT